MQFIKIFSFFIASLICAQSLLAQVKNTHLDVKQQVAICKKLMTDFSGKPDEVDRLIAEGEKGIALSGKGDFEERYGFYATIAAGYYYKRDFPNAKLNFEKGYQLSLQHSLSDQGSKALGSLVSIYHYMELQGKADSAAQTLAQLTASIKDAKTLSDAYYNLGVYNQQQKFFYSIALEDFIKSIELHQPLLDTATNPKWKLEFATKLMMVAEIYLNLKEPQKALEYLEKVKPFLGTSIVLDIAVYGKYVRAYALMKDEKNAENYYKQLNNAATKANAKGKWSEQITSNIQMFLLALEKKDFNAAKKYVDKASELANMDKNPMMISGVDIHYGEYYKALNDNANALKYYEKALSEGVASFNKEGYVDMLRSLVAVEIKQGNNAQALKYFQDYIAVSNELTQQKITEDIAEQEAIYQNKDKQRQIDNQEVQIALGKKEKFWLSFGIIMLAIASVALIINYRNKKHTADVLDKSNKQLALLNSELEASNKTKAKLFAIISHDLRSPIYQVSQFLKIQETNPDFYTQEQKKNLNKKIRTATYALMQTLEDLLLWSKTQMKELNATFQPVNLHQLIGESVRLMQLNLDEKKITVENKIPKNSTVSSDPYFLQTIIRNLLQNAVRESLQNGEIKIEGTEEKFFIQNSGGFFSQKEYEAVIHSNEKDISLSGLGLRTIDELSRKINVEIVFEDTQDQTTKVCVVFQS